MKKSGLIIAILFIFSTKNSMAQGCSDPGICTIGSLNSASTADSVSRTDFTKADIDELLNTAILSEKYNFGVEMGYGEGDRNTNIYSVYLRGSIRLKEKLMLGIKLPYTITEGILGSAQGLGDITLNLQNIIKSGKSFRLAYTIGVVIPTNTANLKSKGRSLPMAYQSSMGLFGGLVGITVSTRKWNGVLGFQQNFGNNGNEFTTEGIILDPGIAGYDTLNRARTNFGSSRMLHNSGDVILRLERGIKIKRADILIGILPIYRIDNFTIKLLNGNTYEVNKSNGLTFNVTAGFSYKFKKNWQLSINAGRPYINRKVAPDGLRRSNVVLMRITKKFW